MAREAHSTGAPGASSRESLAGAGWRECARRGSFWERIPPDAHGFSWLRPATLWQSRNDVLARWWGDPTNLERRRWLAAQRRSGAATGDLVIDGGGEECSFLVLGDPGEGDASQYAVVPPLLAAGAGTAFLVVCSDVIYATGDAADYRVKHFLPYADYPGPIYAVPGNHDWYDSLNGFMLAFCGADPDARAVVERRAIPLTKRWWRRLLWRSEGRIDRDAFEAARALRAAEARGARQPAPYWALDAGPLRLVGIDTGIRNVLDAEQGDWLRRVSRDSPRPKLLITGKPLRVDGRADPGAIEGTSLTVDDIVRDPAHRYVAAIGGDIHNYQRYPVPLPDGRTLQYIVNGGGGAFMHATHRIGRVDLDGVTEATFRCYPLRGDSLAFYARMFDRRLGFGLGLLRLAPDDAARLMAARIGVEPERPSARGAHPSWRERWVARQLDGIGAKGFHRWLSEFFDTNQPPLFKSFLRCDARPGELRIRCFGVTGCGEHEHAPAVEDEVRIPLDQRPSG